MNLLQQTAGIAAAMTITAGLLITSTPARADPAWRGQLRAVTDIAVVTRAQIAGTAELYGYAPLAGPARCDVRVRQLVYATVGPREEVTTASAALLIPQGAECTGPFPVVAYARGTSKDRNRTLANPEDLETVLLINMFATQGMIVVATDYLGYAQSDFSYHPYLHAGSEATSVIDSIRAARASLASSAVATNGRYYVTGYSQGGHAALAAQREIEANGSVEFPIQRVAGMSGPYDLPLTLENGIENAFAAPLGGYSEASVIQQVQLVIGNVLSKTASFLVRNIGRLRDMLRGESVMNYRPVAPVLLCAGRRDLTVSYENTSRAVSGFLNQGSTVYEVDVDQVPEYAAWVPPSNTPSSGLSNYHNRVVPPLCFRMVRDWFLQP